MLDDKYLWFTACKQSRQDKRATATQRNFYFALLAASNVVHLACKRSWFFYSFTSLSLCFDSCLLVNHLWLTRLHDNSYHNHHGGPCYVRLCMLLHMLSVYSLLPGVIFMLLKFFMRIPSLISYLIIVINLIINVQFIRFSCNALYCVFIYHITLLNSLGMLLYPSLYYKLLRAFLYYPS